MTIPRFDLISRRAVLVAAGVCMSATGVAAADLGGNCCADLEERVAELEATTVRKGNRKVSLQLYGSVDQAVVFWDDGGEQNVYVLENNNTKNKLGVRGSAKINSDWSAGYNIELQVRSGRSSSANQRPLATTEGQSITNFNTASVSLRFANWFIKSNTYGEVRVGTQTDVTIGTATVSLVNPGGFANVVPMGYAGQGYLLRRAGTKGDAGSLSSLSWFTGAFGANSAVVNGVDYGPAWHGIKYTSPFFLGRTRSSGLRVQTGWGHDDTFGVALRYAEEFGAFRVAASFGYHASTDSDRGLCSNLSGPSTAANPSTTDCYSLQFGGSLMHTPTGLYVSGGWAEWTDNNRKKLANVAAFNVDNTEDMWYVQAGWQAKLNTLGNTIFWGQYFEKNTGLNLANGVARTIGGGDALNSIGGTVFIANSKTEVWGGGITQNIDAAALRLYAGYYNYSADLTLMSAGGNKAKSNNIDDLSLFFAGATIQF